MGLMDKIKEVVGIEIEEEDDEDYDENETEEDDIYAHSPEDAFTRYVYFLHDLQTRHKLNTKLTSFV